ncbi:MAG: hypothetical protein K0R98_834 [Rickettsiaceae bacterium]|nr:hypothetical protein [Rickettsiaceae bacterium]
MAANKKQICYALLFSTAVGISACSWPGQFWDATAGKIFFKPNKWQDELELGPRRVPAENPNSGAILDSARKSYTKNRGAQSTGSPYPYPPANSSMPTMPGYPSPNDRFQPQNIVPYGAGGTTGKRSNMPIPYPGSTDNDDLNPMMPGQHYIRRFEPMANELYTDGFTVLAKNEVIHQQELPNISPKKVDLFTQEEKGLENKKHSKNMFPIPEYAPKPDAPIVQASSSFPKLKDVPQNPEPTPDKDKFNSDIDSLLKELDKANAKRDADHGKQPKQLPEKTKKKKPDGEVNAGQDADAAALKIKEHIAEDIDKAVLTASNPQDKKDEKPVDFSKRRPVFGNIKAVAEDKKKPKMINEENMATPELITPSANYIPPPPVASPEAITTAPSENSENLLLNSRYTARRKTSN